MSIDAFRWNRLVLHTDILKNGKILAETIKATVNGEKKNIKAKEYTYDSYGNPIEIKDALGNVVKTFYDGQYHIFPEKV